MKKKEDTIKIVLEFEKKNILNIYFQAHSIQKYIEQNKDIPAAELKTLLAYFKQYNRFPEIEKNRIDLITKCYQYLKACEYDFSRKKRILSNSDIKINWENDEKMIASHVEPKKNNVQLSLNNLLEKCFDMIINIDPVMGLRLDKKGMIEIIFGIVNSYNDELGRKRLSNYKIHIITGIIAISSNFIEGKVPSERFKRKSDFNSKLFHEIRNILKKKLPYSPLND